MIVVLIGEDGGEGSYGGVVHWGYMKFHKKRVFKGS